MSEYQIGDDPQYVDVEIDAEKADEVKDVFFIGFSPNLRKRLGYSKAIDIVRKQI